MLFTGIMLVMALFIGATTGMVWIYAKIMEQMQELQEKQEKRKRSEAEWKSASDAIRAKPPPLPGQEPHKKE